MDLIIQAIETSGYQPNEQVSLCLDIAATEFFSDSHKLEGLDLNFTSSEMVHYINELCSKYPITSVEDGLDEDDWTGWTELTKTIGSRVQLVGDDLFVTNPKRIA